MKRRTVLTTGAQMLGLAALPAAMNLARAQAARTPLPLRSFSRRPLMEQVSLSPDGKRLAALVNGESGTMLVTRAAAGGPVQNLMTTDNLEFIFSWIRWINNERLILGLRYPSHREDDFLGVWATTETRLVAINADGSNPINLIKNRGASAKNLRWAQIQDEVLDYLPDGKHILLELPASDRVFDTAVYKVNVDTAERSTYFTARDRIYDWVTDASHQVRVGIGRTEQGVISVWVCDANGKNWRQISHYAAFDRERMYPLGFGLDPDQLYLQALHEGLPAVFTLDISKPDSKPVLKLADKRYALDGSLIHDERGEAVGIRKAVLGEMASFYWDPRYKAWQKELDESLPGRFNMLYAGARNGQDFILTSEVPGQPESVYIANLGDAPSIKLLAQTYPELHKQPLGKKQHFLYKARDGMELHAFVTYPPGAESNERLPVVIMPHGGPQAADGLEFDAWAAFIADRGYLVVQPNFRGSTGYGEAYMEAGLRRWGLEMQDDLEDVVRHCVDSKWADPSRVAIVGASYGGYAALMGAVKTPDLYRGAFAFAPVTDLIDFVDDAGQGSRREAVRRQIGDARDDVERLRSTSPVLHAQKIKVPVVLLHGTHDRQVDYKHSVKMAEALKKAGKVHSFHTFDKGDHQLSHQAYRDQLFGHLEKFLAQVLAPRG
ncbi:S9 family peptidase [Roseateles flavus]|uniref:Prolyl oligopeptidase family serine peptidase n=1 Tax=Roseateles flavus TaxID=3149041 RepID=A0ABV0GC82_9BURK